MLWLLWNSVLVSLFLVSVESLPVSGTETDEIISYYNQLTDSINQVFPESGEAAKNDKRAQSRHGRDTSDLSDAIQLAGLSERLKSEEERRKRLDDEKQPRVLNDENMSNKLKALRNQLTVISENMPNQRLPQEADILPTTVTQPQQILESNKALVLKIQQQITSIKDKIDGLLNNQPKYQKEATEDLEASSLERLSAELAANSKASTEGTPYKQSIKDGGDRLAQLALLVKNLIQVNKLAYLSLSNRIEEVKTLK